MDRHYKRSNCQGCGKTYVHRQSLYNHKQKCQALRNKKDNEGDVSGVNEKDSQTSNKSETGAKKRKADCLEESKDIPTFEEPEFSGTKSLSDETLFRMMEALKNNVENRARILKLEKRFKNPNSRILIQESSKKRNTQASIFPVTTLTTKQVKIDVNHLIDSSGILLD